ncbi:hypothetical protein NIES2119_13705 [[Phormidium ambiguum] IAM M-71]|uniref:Uncharacterized protein n=1 Tax=[Phormidium ambiguum] IAM M-71 TaxID=454136 RepID=A0A1U7IJK4_9CYAN|nr:hypothetical protein [Phormidium ambiguum]OKH37305.1 hypothetical protein NIES2119_13705 [Phormidium ambiguum IAM M-71]
MKYKLGICIFFLAFVVSSCGSSPQGNLFRDDELTTAPAPQRTTLRDDDNRTQFQEALNLANSATNLAKSAKSETDWKAVANQLNKAILLMQLVPKSDRNYKLSQQKVVEYQKSLAEVEKKLKL